VDYLLTGNETVKSPALKVNEDEAKVLKYYSMPDEEQKAVDMRNQGSHILIVHENDFWDVV
jgi:hypothetical protein